MSNIFFQGTSHEEPPYPAIRDQIPHLSMRKDDVGQRARFGICPQIGSILIRKTRGVRSLEQWQNGVYGFGNWFRVAKAK